MSDYIGIDYGRLDGSNRDKETGIHYGVISVHSLMPEAIYESLEADYGPATCGHCGNEAVVYNEEKHGEYEKGRGCSDYACEHCEKVFDSDEAFGDEPVAQILDDGEYRGFLDEYNDVWITMSPYFTYAAFCSPCAPGAGHLDSPRPADSGASKVYCFDGSWFDDDKAPYDVYSVKTGKLVAKAGEAHIEEN